MNQTDTEQEEENIPETAKTIDKNAKKEKKKRRIYRSQNFLMLLIHFMLYTIIFLNEKSMYVLVFYGAQLCFFIVALFMYNNIYRNASRLLINNMFFLMMIGFVMLTRLDMTLAVKQFLIAVASVAFSLAVPVIVEKVGFLSCLGIVYGILGLGVVGSVFIFGTKVYGATNWVSIAGIGFQPSELAKIVLILFFARFFSKHAENLNTVKTIGLSFVLIGIPLLLIVTQPDTSTSIAIALIFISLLFIAGLSYKIVLTVLGICIPTGLIGITVILRMAQSSGDYRFGRIMAWLYPQDPRWSDIAAQQQNSIMAIGSGQLWGKGLNNSAATSMKNANYIIEPQTDFIFAVAGEELGFIGTMVIVLLLLFIVIECILIARKAKDLAGRLICCGMAALIGFQSIFNIFVATGLMPNTGIPLPFVSYGLTSLLSLYLGMGFVLNVGLQPKKY